MNEKQVRKKLRELAEKAHEEELRQALAPVAEAFERWRIKEVSSFEISDLIHEFHQGPSRTIWGTYTALKPDALVARAVALGFLPREHVPPEMLASLAQRIDAYTPEDEQQMQRDSSPRLRRDSE
jgi:hypothetical protein